MNGHWHLERQDGGILRLGLGVDGASVNVLSAQVIAELDERLADIERKRPTALIVCSLKETGFVAGADVREFVGRTDQAELGGYIRRIHGVLDRLESLPCPTLALIHGFCLGGGLELALACRYRIASDATSTRLGFPEVRLGIFPGFGGTWRAIRNLGALPAMGLMLGGRALGARQALEIGLVDMAVPLRQMEAAARDFLERFPVPYRPGLMHKLVGLPPLRQVAAAWLEHATSKRVSRTHYPAPFELIAHWRQSGNDGPALLASEAERVPRLLTGKTAQNLVRVFHLQERLKGLGRGAEPEPQRIHVIGAGVMGGDIAAWAALQGKRVSLEDLAQDQLGRAMQRADALFCRRLRDPRLVRDAWDRLMPDPRGDALAGADLVIEAIVEDAESKQGLLAELEQRVDGATLLATNTSSIPLETLSAGLAHPERLIGLHFFNPVERMQLVEVVHGPATSDDALGRGLAFARSIDRLPLPVNSSPGFLVNRVLMPYLMEAMDLLEEGVPAPVIDAAAVDFGMPIGPIALADSVGLDICLAVAEMLGTGLTAPEETPERLREMVREGKLGRKSGLGFYRYKKGSTVIPRVPLHYRAPPDLAERMVFRLLNEAVACLREGIVEDADLLDAGVIFGTGFAPFRGGPMHYIEQGGWGEMHERLHSLERDHGGHFRPDRGWDRLARV